jgi:ABC-type branched-subunit amino acid transport system substrate-binding protein
VKATAGSDIPVILPTATADDLAVGDEVFQLNVPFSVRGKVLAEYVRDDLKARTVAILAPLRSFARDIAESFKNHARKIGLQVDVVSWYRPGTDDMNRQFNTLRTRQFGDSIEVLFAPVESPSEIPLILEGVANTHVTNTILGAGDWNYPDSIAAYIRPNIRVEFATEYALDSARTDYNTFAAYYRSLTNMKPSKHAVFGYDAAGLLMRSLCGNSRTRAEVMKELLEPYNGIHSLIALSPQRQNTALTIMRYRNRTVYKVKTIKENVE